MKKCEVATMCGLLHYLPNELIKIPNKMEYGIDQMFSGVKKGGYKTVCMFCYIPVKRTGSDNGTLLDR